jgi:MFS family permease
VACIWVYICGRTGSESWYGLGFVYYDDLISTDYIQLGPVVAGVMTEKYGWRSFWWCNTAVCTLAIVYQIFLLPETKWNRGIDFLINQSAQSFEQSENSTTDESSEKPSIGAINSDSIPSGMPPSEEEILVKLSGGPSRMQFMPYNGFDNSERILDALWLSFKLSTFPIIQWSSFVFSWAASCFLVANVTQSQAFAGPPWNLSTAAVGYANFALFVGASIALLIAGPLSDWVSIKAIIKNKGI